jgi:hypothetical protein
VRARLLLPDPGSDASSSDEDEGGGGGAASGFIADGPVVLRCAPQSYLEALAVSGWKMPNGLKVCVVRRQAQQIIDSLTDSRED